MHRVFKVADLKALLYRYIRPDIQVVFDASQLNVFNEAFTHRSMKCDISYERLEFLGDAVASCILTSYIFRRYTGRTEAFLSRMRSHMISGKVYATVAVHVGLPGWLRLPTTSESLRLRPSVQEDVFEAFVAALYLTFGYFIAEMWTICVFEEHIDISAIARETHNPKERIVNHCLAAFHERPRIDVESDDNGTFFVRVYHPETKQIVAEASSHVCARAVADACDLAFSALFSSDTVGPSKARTIGATPETIPSS